MKMRQHFFDIQNLEGLTDEALEELALYVDVALHVSGHHHYVPQL